MGYYSAIKIYNEKKHLWERARPLRHLLQSLLRRKVASHIRFFLNYNLEQLSFSFVYLPVSPWSVVEQMFFEILDWRGTELWDCPEVHMLGDSCVPLTQCRTLPYTSPHLHCPGASCFLSSRTPGNKKKDPSYFHSAQSANLAHPPVFVCSPSHPNNKTKARSTRESYCSLGTHGSFSKSWKVFYRRNILWLLKLFLICPLITYISSFLICVFLISSDSSQLWLFLHDFFGFTVYDYFHLLSTHSSIQHVLPLQPSHSSHAQICGHLLFLFYFPPFHVILFSSLKSYRINTGINKGNLGLQLNTFNIKVGASLLSTLM